MFPAKELDTKWKVGRPLNMFYGLNHQKCDCTQDSHTAMDNQMSNAISMYS